MKNLKKSITVALMFLLVPLAACGGGTSYGDEVTGEANTAIADALSKGKAANGEDAVIEGKVTSVCPSGCWFDIADDNGNTMHILIAMTRVVNFLSILYSQC